MRHYPINFNIKIRSFEVLHFNLSQSDTKIKSKIKVLLIEFKHLSVTKKSHAEDHYADKGKQKQEVDPLDMPSFPVYIIFINLRIKVHE